MKAKILVLDDEEMTRTQLKGILEEQGHEVKLTSHSGEVDAAFRNAGDFGLFFLSQNLYGKDNLHVMETFLRKDPALKAIVLAGPGGRQAAVDAFRKGAFDYLDKPVVRTDVLNTLARSEKHIHVAPAIPIGTTIKPRFDAPLSSDMSYTDMKKQWSDSFEKDYLVNILNRNAGNVSAAARESKLDRSNFLRLLRRHGLQAQAYRKAA